MSKNTETVRITKENYDRLKDISARLEVPISLIANAAVAEGIKKMEAEGVFIANKAYHIPEATGDEVPIAYL